MTQDKNRRLVYSSSTGRVTHCKKCDRSPCACENLGDLRPEHGPLRLRLETSGRGGKAVTVLFDLVANPKSLKAWAKKMKNHCGTGGSVKKDSIEVQGDQREKLKSFLENQGFKVILSGGRL